METILEKNRQLLAQKAVSAFFEIISAMDRDGKTTVTVGLSGGSSPLEFYGTAVSRIRELPEALRKKLRFVLLDERLVPSNHPDSNFKLLSERFAAPLRKRDPRAPYPFLRLRTELPDAAEAYAEEISEIDVGIFGVWPDGHIASLFPNHPGLSDQSGRFVRISDSPKPPADRISVSAECVRTMGAAFVFFMGGEKAAAYRAFLNPSVPEAALPAKLLLGCRNLRIVTDLKA